MWRHFHQLDWIAEINGDFIIFTNSSFPVLHLVLHFSVIILNGGYFLSAVNFKLYTCPRQISFTYRWIFSFDKICIHDILIDNRLELINVTRKGMFAILNTNLTSLNWTPIRKTTWKRSVLGFLVLKKLLVTKSKRQNKTFLDH